jgi:hypothetical protein
MTSTPASIDELVAKGDTSALTELAEGKDKKLAKEARRGLHVLRTRGVKVAALSPQQKETPAIVPAIEAEELPCLVSSIDAGGERALWLVRAESGGGRLIIYEAYLHERHGITQFRASEIARKAWRKLSRELLAVKENFAVAEVPWRFARAALEEAYQRNQEAARSAPVEFLRARPQLGKAEMPARHPALELWDKVPAPSPEQATRMHDWPECRAWMPEPEELERTAGKLAEVDQSQLLVDAQQKTAARADAIARAVREYFEDPKRRARMRARLLDAAYLTHQAGRDDDAKVARALADEFEPGKKPEESPFSLRLFEKCFRPPPDAASEEEEAPPEPTPGGLIVPP